MAVTHGPGLAGSLLVGINFAKALAWVHDKPLVGVNHLEGHVYAAWLLDPGEDEATRRSRSFPLVALVVSGGHTFLVEMTDHLTYRLLGKTVDDAAGEAFDKVGRLLGLGYPGRAGDPAGRRGRDAARRPCSRGPGWATRTTSASPASRRPRGGSSTPPAPTAGPRRRRHRGATAATASTAELAWGFQDSVVDVLATKTIRAAAGVGARSIVLGGGVAANSVPARRASPARPRRCGVPLIVPRPGLCTDNGAMIGAAGARRFVAGERAAPRPRRAAVAAAGATR